MRPEVLRRRTLWVFTLTIAAFAVLLGRLFVVTALPGEVPAKMAAWAAKTRTGGELEHFHLVQTDDGRGRVLFRNGQPWSGTFQVAGKDWPSASHGGQVLRVHREDGQSGSSDPLLGRVGRPDVWPDPGRAVAEQGRYGLEARFDQVLQGRRPAYVGWLTDIHGQPVDDTRRYHLDAVSGANIRTTLDPAWQRLTKQVLQTTGVKHGAVVVLSVAHNDILAMANRDVQNPYAITAVSAQVPGSVFKVVTAAAALDSYRVRPHDVYYCPGEVDLPGVNMHCWRVHGRETFQQAFAQSCDVAFAEVGHQVGRQGLSRMAQDMGLLTTGLQVVDGTAVLQEAQPGRVFLRPGWDDGLLANTAIGQEDVRISPLQGANLASAVARGGVVAEANLVMDAERQGQVVRSYERGRVHRAMSSFAAAEIGSMMHQAVVSSSGTAHALSGLRVDAAVKTGTAEIGNGKVNGWMIGFAPYRHPQIAFCVFVGDEPSATAHQQATEVTRSILETVEHFQADAANF
ncbi:hypothetical protein LLE49_00890 [Alicyclobacillus tolerans]|uniref:penicillin-binding transpeptidase domain-containing protein n=1 Tax=Alicyclobacillus tolerans TaxID=90970 RepID=UPI001F1E4B1C|nr:penicillin-binding transpeptidase domain-containing protein [Alicyclobacillus tolerans]MCF8563300.1 hypothetical protein [Alicyclobacillus tolerans]